jgi:queuine tRNA-ribosyltransferase
LRTIQFEIVARCPHTGARAGLLHTAHGTVETPVFMPVGTQATVKGLTPDQLANELGARIILANTYHLYLRPGHERIERLGGLHGFTKFPNAFLTDSGGFQVWSLSQLRKITEQGVTFRSHLDGSAHLFTPESTVDVQLALGSDILMMLDECTHYPATPKEARRSMELTVRWAERGMRHYRMRQDERWRRQALFPIVQGSMDEALRRECAGRLTELDADGYAIGGLSVGEPRDLSQRMTEVTAPLLPDDRPRYVMGVGLPEELPEYVSRGVDMMDCVMPSRNARNGCLFTRQGRLIIKQTRFKDDPRPVDEACRCYCCRTFSRAYLRHLFQCGEMLYSTLSTLHNLAYYLDIMRGMREAILLGTFPEYLSGVRSLASASRPVQVP